MNEQTVEMVDLGGAGADPALWRPRRQSPLDGERFDVQATLRGSQLAVAGDRRA